MGPAYPKPVPGIGPAGGEQVGVDAPPLPVRVAYRVVGWRPGPEHRDWVLDDIRSGRATRWSLLPAFAFCVVPAALYRWQVHRRAGDLDSPGLVSLAALVVGVALGLAIV